MGESKMITERDVYWMQEAIKFAKQGMIEFNELPIATILVGNGQELGRGVTSNVRANSLVAHGEQLVLMNTPKSKLLTEKPLTLYTTLEPCIMCLGAAIECGVDRIVYGMPAGPDGGACYADPIRGIKEEIPIIEGGVLEKEQYQLMKEFRNTHDETSPAWYYVNLLLNQYEGQNDEL